MGKLRAKRKPLKPILSTIKITLVYILWPQFALHKGESSALVWPFPLIIIKTTNLEMELDSKC